MEFGISQNLF